MSQTPQAQRDAALAELETVRAQAETLVLKQAMHGRESGKWHRPPQVLQEHTALRDVPSEYRDPWRYSDPHFFGQGIFTGHVPWSQLEDRLHGDWYPAYRNEQDLALVRGQSRNLAVFANVAIGAMEALVNYVIGTGFTFDVQEREGRQVPDGLVSAVQAVVDRFLDDNNIAQGVDPLNCNVTESLDREIHNSSREDGESFVALYPLDDTGRAKCCVIQPDQVREPADSRGLEEWLGIGDQFVSHWRYGVHTREDPRMQCEDVARPLGYYVVFDGAGDNWDYVPAERMVHLKRNVGSAAKRGVSDYLAVQRDIEREAKLRANTAEGAAVQAAIAFIREHAQGATQAGVQQFVRNLETHDYDKAIEGGVRDTSTERMRPGTVKDIPSGMKYHAGPMGELRSPVFIEVAGYVLRSIGVRWSMPEYIISGDASNANFSSTLVAESPFVKARENDQQFYKRGLRSIVWKALKIAWDAEVFDSFGIPDFETMVRLLELKIDAPEVASRDRLQQAQVNSIEHQAGVLSRQTWAAETGRDYDQEQDNIEQEPLPIPPGVQGAVAGMLGESLRQGSLFE